MITAKKKTASCSPKTAVAYARYSSAGQRDVSIEQQLNDIRAYAAREGYTIVHEYADHAKSGFRHVEARKQFQAMISAAAKGKFSTIICWKVDRFGRSRADSALYKRQLEEYGVSVRYVMEHIPEGASGFLTEGMLETIAEWYSRNLSENVKRGMLDNAKKCLFNGTTVYGYDGVRNERYRINEEQAAVVRQIYAEYAKGYSMISICRHLNNAGIRTESGNLFTINKLHNILKQERYLGYYIFKDIRIPDGMPAIIDQETWEKAQIMKKKTGRHYENSPADFLLTGKAFCGYCGKPMVGDSGTSNTGKTYYYYTCQRHKNRSGCQKRSVRRDFLEDYIVNFLLDNVLSGPEMERIANSVYEYQKKEHESSPLRAMQKELKETERKIENVNRAIGEGIFTNSTKVMLLSLEEQAEQLRQQIEARKFAEGVLMDKEQILFFLEGFSAMDRNDPDNRRSLVRVFLNSVYLYDDHYRIIVNTSDCFMCIPFEDLPPLPESSDRCFSRLLKQTYPNSVFIEYWVQV